MDKSLIYIPEPMMLFGYNQEAEDPRDGLTIFGPYEPFSSYGVQAGVIGTDIGIQKYQRFVKTIQGPILSHSIKRPSFPGFESIFGIEWSSTPAIARSIEARKIDKAVKLPNLHERTFNLVNLYLDEIKKVQAEEETRVDIWFVVVPRAVWRECRPQSSSREISLNSENLKAYRRGQASLFAEMNKEYAHASKILDFSGSFHDQLKARVLQERIQVPIQIILEPTLQFRNKYNNWEYADKMKAHLAWTQSSAVYYKLGKLPWKLSDIRTGVCYVGLVFKKYRGPNRAGFACSAAQMFLDSGDGTVFKGNIGPWQSKSKRDFHLDKSSAKELISLAMKTYHEKRGEYPTELFIHGRAGFSDDEWNGFEEAVNQASDTTQLVGIVIKESDKLKLFRDTPKDRSNYGNLRGLGLIVDNWEGFLWTRGYVPRLKTSTSLEVPNPLRVQINRGYADMEQVLADILALTKLNYNACIYGDGLPVTLRFSDLIGNILTAVGKIENKVLPFKYYI